MNFSRNKAEIANNFQKFYTLPQGWWLINVIPDSAVASIYSLIIASREITFNVNVTEDMMYRFNPELQTYIDATIEELEAEDFNDDFDEEDYIEDTVSIV